MAAIVVPNTLDDIEPVPAPTREDGSPYMYEMLFNGFVDRAYADTAEDLLACLIPRYLTMTPAERFAALLGHAVRVQTTVQADINYEHNNLIDCTPAEIAVLSSSRATPPQILTWSCPVPIVLVDVFYKPLGDLPRATSAAADVIDPPNILWLRVEDQGEYLNSLATVGFIQLNMHNDYV